MLTFEALPSLLLEVFRSSSHLDGETSQKLQGLLLVQDEQRKAGSNDPVILPSLLRQILSQIVDLLQQQSPEHAELLRLRFLEGESVLTVAHKLKLSEDQAKRLQRDAILRCARLLWAQESDIRERRIQALQSQLSPPLYGGLLGIAHQLETLLDCLVAERAPWVLVITGIGGIGKTALADAAARQVIPHYTFAQMAWLTINGTEVDEGSNTPQKTWNLIQKQLIEKLVPRQPTSLKQYLQQVPTLVVIDNLEISANSLHYVVENLADLANPSKFLLTSRVRPPVTSTMWCLSLEELSESDSSLLIRQQAQTIGLNELAQAPDAIIQIIVDHVGGNPLALKLVVGLATVLSLPEILTDLSTARAREISQMYRHIYWRAWHSLDAISQLLLEMMPMTAGIGAKLEQLQAISALEKTDLLMAVSQLVQRSLLEVRGTLDERRYSIHRLTDSFLRTEIIHWPASSTENKQP